MEGLARKRNPPAMDIGRDRRYDGGVGAARARHGLWPDRSGATAVMVALSTPILLAIAGLGVDAGFWFAIKRQNQSAADAAALSAAYEVAYATGNQLAAATQAATANGWVNNTNPPAGLTPITVNYPCSSSTCTFAAGGIQVVLQQQQPTWLANFASLANVTITNSAVAVVSNLPPACMLALNPTLADAINLAGNPTINAPSCTIVSDSDASSAVHLQGAASITAATLITPGQISHTGAAYTLDLSHPAQIGANPIPDPYASTLTHSNFLTDGLSTAGACTAVSGGYANPGGTNPGCVISGNLDIKNATVNLAPGTYWIEGNLTLENGSGATLECTTCSSGGSGVTIILTAPPGGGTVGTVSLGSNADLNLNAPSTGPFAGMVLIQDSNGLPTADSLPNPDDFSASANATETLNGLVYFPDAAVTFQGTPASTDPCLVLVANTVAMQGNPSLAINGCSSIGLTTLPLPKTVTLVQ